MAGRQDTMTAMASTTPRPAWRRYFGWSTDHKVIGLQYIVTSFFFFLVGGAMAGMIRAQLLAPDSTLVSAEAYNRLTTNHGSVMLFLWILPVLAGLSNYLIPLQIGARDMAFPRLNALSFWLLVPSGVLMLASFFVGAAEAGWTAYVPLSITGPDGQTLWAISVVLLGTSSMMGALNFVTTVFTMRAPRMTFLRLP